MTSLQIALALILGLPTAYFVYTTFTSPPSSPAKPLEETTSGTEQKTEEKTSIMQAERTDLAPPKDDPFTLTQLRPFDGSDPSKPIYVAIKGTVFDVTHKRETYGPGASYNIFAGRDASRGLGKSSLKEADAVSDYSDLPENERKVLDDWHAFFTKRYNIVGKVIDLPKPAVSNL